MNNPQNMTNKELAEKFQMIANDFFEFIKDNKLEETQVNMSEGFDLRSEHCNLCDTPACHGGWAAIMYDGVYSDVPAKFKSSVYFFLSGAEKISRRLGFSHYIDFTKWAKNNPDYWGSYDGAFMFSDQSAFGKDEEDPTLLTLTDIAVWYQNVAKRLLGE